MLLVPLNEDEDLFVLGVKKQEQGNQSLVGVSCQNNVKKDVVRGKAFVRCFASPPLSAPKSSSTRQDPFRSLVARKGAYARRRPIFHSTPNESVPVVDQPGEAFETEYDRLLNRRLPRERVQLPNSTRCWPAKARRWRHREAVRFAQAAYLRPSKIRQSTATWFSSLSLAVGTD
jgi:hypothetical protein